MWLLFVCEVGKAQDDVFYVINQTHTAEMYRTRILGFGYTKEMRIKNTHKGYIALLHTSNSTVELFGAGEWNVSDLENMVLNKQKETRNNVVHIGIGDQTNILPEYGSLCRCSNTCPPFEVQLPAKTFCMFDEYTFAWEKLANVNTYKVCFTNVFDEIIKEIDIKGTAYTFKFSELLFQKEEDFVMVTVTPEKGLKTKTFAFILDAYKHEKIKQQYESLLQKSDKQKQILFHHMREAFFFEKNECFIDAYEAYKKLYQLSDKEPVFSKMLQYAKKRMDIGSLCR